MTDFTLTMTAQRGSVAIRDFLIYRSIDNAAFVHIDTTGVDEVDPIDPTLYRAFYNDTAVFEDNVRYYTVARDSLLNLADDSNIVQVDAPQGIFFVAGTAVSNEGWRISEDGETWTQIAQQGTCARCLWLEAYQRWVMIGGSEIWTSDQDATVWTVRTPVGYAVNDSNTSVDYDPVGNVLVVVSNNGVLWYSLNGGVSWTLSATSNAFEAVAWDATIGRFVIPHDSTSQLRPTFYSPDGVNWTQNANVDSMGSTEASSNGAGKVLAIGPNTGVGFGGGLWTTLDGVTWTNGGLGLNIGNTRSLDHNGARWGYFGTSGANSVFVHSTTGANGSWSSVVVATTTLSGTTMDTIADPSRNCWWVVGRRRIYKSTDDAGSGWTEKVAGGAFSFNCLGVRPAA